MSSSSNLMMMIVMVVTVLLVMSPGVPTTSAVVSGICDVQSFPDGDQRILCVSTLLADLIGLWASMVQV
ncbi:unnamed protein product [Linum trigynum]|uniref:Uncharacterized protein n=1 Tax=Linum trigynum TaxID=586398 RepID=A0AAV2CN38_9ROSI